MRRSVVVVVSLLGACTSQGITGLVTTSVVPPGENCANGGVVVRSGLDDGGDGSLDGDEVVDTTFVCNGNDGADGTNGAAGANGTDGTTGTPGTDGTNGTDGVDTLVRTEAVEGDECGDAGGYYIYAGPDTNDDGELDLDTEADPDATVLLCNGQDGADAGGDPITVVYGSYNVANSADLEDLQAVQQITGSLNINGIAGLDAILLPELVSVGTALSVTNNTAIDIAFPKLQSVGGNLQFANNSGLVDLDVGELGSVGGALFVTGNAVLESVEAFETVVSLGGGLEAQNNAKLTSLAGWENIPAVNGTIRIINNAILADITALNDLASVTGDVYVHSNPMLPTCEVEAWRDEVGVGNITGSISISGNAACD